MSQSGDTLADRSAVRNTEDQRQQDKRPVRKDLKPLLALLPFIARYPGIILGAGAMLLLASGATLVFPLAVRQMIDLGFSKENAQSIDQYFLFLMGVAGVLAVASATRYFFVTWLGERVVADLRATVYAHVTELSPSFFEVTRTGEVLSRLTTDTQLIQTVVGSSLSIALRNFVTFGGSLLLLVWTSPGLAGLVLVALPLVVVPIILFGRAVRRFSRRAQDRVAETSAIAGESLGAVQTLQAFTHEKEARRAFSTAVEGAFEVAIRRTVMSAGLSATSIILAFTIIVGVLWVGARAVIDGGITGGELGQFMLYAALMAGAMGALSEVWGDVQRAAGATERLVELLEAVPAIAAPASPVTLAQPVRGEILFKDVTFAYPTRPETPALQGFDLGVKPGETVALVGPSGAGKSTVFQLLLRFYDVQAGTVAVDGVPIRDLVPQDLRGALALVPQDPVIFAATALENIRYGRTEADPHAVTQAARAAAADDFITALPSGYDTLMGERGMTLSGGQRQRIAVARAILRDAPILLLDEATSALDAESEHLVQLALERVMKGRTTLVIAHRLATVLKADRIVVMDQGRVVAEGRHQDLLDRGGLYARLAALQFATTEPNHSG